MGRGNRNQPFDGCKGQQKKKRERAGARDRRIPMPMKGNVEIGVHACGRRCVDRTAKLPERALGCRYFLCADRAIPEMLLVQGPGRSGPIDTELRNPPFRQMRVHGRTPNLPRTVCAVGFDRGREACLQRLDRIHFNGEQGCGAGGLSRSEVSIVWSDALPAKLRSERRPVAQGV